MTLARILFRVEGDLDDLLARRVETPDHGPILDNVSVIGRVSGARHRLRDLDQVVLATDILQLRPGRKLVLQSDEVDRLEVDRQLLHRLEDFAMCGVIEVCVDENGKNLLDRLLPNDHRAQDRHFGFDVKELLLVFRHGGI